jgi:poly(A) polymerase
MEVMKLLRARGAEAALWAMSEAGLLLAVLGGVPLIPTFAAMTKQEAAAGLAPDAVRRLGALAVLVTEDAERLAQRLRLTNVEAERLRSLGEGWWRVTPAESDGRALLYRLGPERFIDRVLKAWAHAPADASEPDWTALVTLPQRWHAPAFPLKAADMMARGVGKGPALGAALRAAEEAWIAAGFPSDRDARARITDAIAALHKPD